VFQFADALYIVPSPSSFFSLFFFGFISFALPFFNCVCVFLLQILELTPRKGVAALMSIFLFCLLWLLLLLLLCSL
jgi:hypothetical protein